MEKNSFGGIDENLRKGLEATEQVSVEKLEAGLKENQEQALSGAEKKKEEIWQQIKDEVKRGECGVGDIHSTEENVEIEKVAPEVNPETALAPEKTSTELFEEAQAMEAEEKAGGVQTEEVKSEKVTGSREERSLEAIKTEFDELLEKQRKEGYSVDLHKEIAKVFDELEIKQEKIKTEGETKEEHLKRIRSDFSRQRRAVDRERGYYALYGDSASKFDYEVSLQYQKKFLLRSRREAIESKGLLDRETGEYKKLTPEEVQAELDKYTKEVIVPHFTVAEAAKIQVARSEANPSLLEKMKNNKFSKLAYGAVDTYRKADWKKKIALSAGLLGAGVVAGATGGTVGLALAGIVTGGKGIQRFLSGAGMAVATEALIQRSQQKWMEKEGWGKNRHEYIAKQIASLRESAKKGGAFSETEIEKLLSEREAMEKSNEVNRAILAGITGTLVGSGTLWQAVKQYGEWLGFSGALVPEKGQLPGHKIEVPAEEKALPFVEIEKPIKLEIGIRGPEGAIIDELKNNPELAKKFGWDGDTDISEWAGAKAHTLWMASADEMRGDPTRISKGSIFLDPENGGSIKLSDTEYLEGVAGQAVATTEGHIPTGAESGATPEAPAEDLFNVPDYGTDVHDRSPSAQLNAGDRVLADLVDQEKINEFNAFGEKYMEDLKKIMSADYIEQNKDYYVADMVEKAKQGGIDFESMLNTEKLQEVMDSPLGKFGAVTSKFAAIEQKDLGATIARMGGMKEFMKMKVSELYGPDGLPSRDIAVNKLAMELSRLTGGDLERRGGSTLKEIFDSIKSKEIFGGSAEELVKKGKQ